MTQRKRGSYQSKTPQKFQDALTVLNQRMKWLDVATHLGVDVKTVRYWRKHGPPSAIVERSVLSIASATPLEAAIQSE